MSEHDDYPWTEHGAAVNAAYFDLHAAKLEQMKRQVQGDLNARLFLDASGFHVTPPITWRDRLRWRWNGLVRYGSTLWRALKGDDPYESDW